MITQTMYNAFKQNEWVDAGLKDFCEFSDCIEYVNQSYYGDDHLEGEWYYCDDEKLTIYFGSFGNYNSPGASSYTYASVYETVEDYQKMKAAWESYPEYID